MGLIYSYFDENHRKIGIVHKWTTDKEKEKLKLLYDLDEVRTEE